MVPRTDPQAPPERLLPPRCGGKFSNLRLFFSLFVPNEVPLLANENKQTGSGLPGLGCSDVPATAWQLARCSHRRTVPAHRSSLVRA